MLSSARESMLSLVNTLIALRALVTGGSGARR